MKTPRCFDCGHRAVDTCPECGLSFCALCAGREGESCCGKAAELPIAKKARADGFRAGMEAAAKHVEEHTLCTGKGECSKLTADGLRALAKEQQ